MQTSRLDFNHILSKLLQFLDLKYFKRNNIRYSILCLCKTHITEIFRRILQNLRGRIFTLHSHQGTVTAQLPCAVPEQRGQTALQVVTYLRIMECQAGKDLKDYLTQLFLAKSQLKQDGPAPCAAESQSVQH